MDRDSMRLGGGERVPLYARRARVRFSVATGWGVSEVCAGARGEGRREPTSTEGETRKHPPHVHLAVSARPRYWKDCACCKLRTSMI